MICKPEPTKSTQAASERDGTNIFADIRTRPEAGNVPTVWMPENLNRLVNLLRCESGRTLKSVRDEVDWRPVALRRRLDHSEATPATVGSPSTVL